MSKILYPDKVGITPKETHINQVWDDDMNEIKLAVNDNFDLHEALEIEVDTNTLDIVDIKDDILELESGTKNYFTVESDDTFSVPDSTTPSFMTNILQVNGIKGFTVNSATGSVQNTSGKDLIMIGNLAIQYLQSGNGDTDFYIYSQTSTDGINWTANVDSLRHLIISRNGIGYKSIVSFLGSPWVNGSYVRFMFGKTDNTLEFEQLTQLLGTETVSGHSFFWTMQEQ